MGRKVLVIGGGGREHALALRLLESESVSEVVVSPGNGGTHAAPARLQPKVLRSLAGAPLEVAQHEQPDLVVVGPEAPLCDGLVDQLEANGLLAFGPRRAAAQLEGSKAFMKAFAERHAIRTARHVRVQSVVEAERAIAEFEQAPVVKADGLCAGKGVVVAESHAEALAAAREMLSGARFGAAGETVVIEERLLGQEASVHAICDGKRALVLPAAQDHKRIGDGDSGANTGGMGAYAPAPLLSGERLEVIRAQLMERAVLGMAADGVAYRGALFAGLMIDASGDAVLLEYNVRFGDPETEVLMNVVDGDLAEALAAAARGELRPDALRSSAQHALCVVLAAAGYPGKVRSGDRISGLAEAEALPGVQVYHAGTRREGSEIYTSGGRVLCVSGSGSSLELAHERAYDAADRIRFEGRQLRRDIGARALGSK